MKGMQMKEPPTPDKNTVSWFSLEEDQKEHHIQGNINWMESKPEDSMGWYMHHKKESMPETNNQMEHKGH